eukprot:403364135
MQKSSIEKPQDKQSEPQKEQEQKAESDPFILDLFKLIKSFENNQQQPPVHNSNAQQQNVPNFQQASNLNSNISQQAEPTTAIEHLWQLIASNNFSSLNLSSADTTNPEDYLRLASQKIQDLKPYLSKMYSYAGDMYQQYMANNNSQQLVPQTDLERGQQTGKNLENTNINYQFNRANQPQPAFWNQLFKHFAGGNQEEQKVMRQSEIERQQMIEKGLEEKRKQYDGQPAIKVILDMFIDAYNESRDVQIKLEEFKKQELLKNQQNDANKQNQSADDQKSKKKHGIVYQNKYEKQQCKVCNSTLEREISKRSCCRRRKIEYQCKKCDKKYTKKDFN